MKDKLICITCPRGCDLKIEKKGEKITVTGNACKRGETYALQEIKDPRRTLTTTIRVEGGNTSYTSCRTNKPVPKNLMFKALHFIEGVTVKAPIKTGDVLIENILGTGSDIIATKSVGSV